MATTIIFLAIIQLVIWIINIFLLLDEMSSLCGRSYETKKSFFISMIPFFYLIVLGKRIKNALSNLD